MEKRKSNKKLFAIIGGSVLAFVLTIALSVSLTLAYFGESKAANSAAIKLNDPVTLGNGTASSVTTEMTVIPTQWVDVTATADITKSGTSSVLFAYAQVTDGIAAEEDSDSFDDKWELVGSVDGKDLYAYYGDKDATALSVIAAAGAEDEEPADITMTYSFRVDPMITNAQQATAGTSTVNVTFVRVQQVYTTKGGNLSTKASDYKAAIAQVLGYTTETDIAKVVIN